MQMLYRWNSTDTISQSPQNKTEMYMTEYKV